MVREINFLSERQKTVSRQEGRDKRLLLLAGIGVGVMMLFFLGVLITGFYFDNQTNALRVQESALMTQISGSRDTEEAFVIFSHKLSNLVQIYQDRLEKRAAIAYFTTLFGPNVEIRSIEFDPQNKVLLFRIQSTDIFVLQHVFKLVNSADVRSKFKSLNPSDLNRDPDGKYQMSIAVSTQQAKL